MWGRAAENNEDNVKAEMNGGDDSISNDQIVQEYDESTKDLNHSAQLEIVVDREDDALQHRLTVDWEGAKRALVTLQGGK